MRLAGRSGLVVLLILLGVPQLASAKERRSSDRQLIEVALGGSTILAIRGGKITLTDPTIAEITPASGGILVIGRKVGETNLIVHGSNVQKSWLVKVTLPAQAIQSELARMFPREEIEARAVGGSLVLVGTVSSTPVVTQAEELTLGYLRSPSIAALGVAPHVINLLKVRSRQQVQLEVKFAEVNRRSLREVGVNLVGGTANGRVGAAFGQGGVVDTNPRPNSAAQSIVPGQPAQRFSPNTSAMGAIFFGIPNGKFPLAATLNLLAERNLSKTLAEPTLVALSGQPASFLVGGEVPFQTSVGLGNIAIEFKPFGIQLGFTPTVMGDDTITLNTSVKVSFLDPTIATLGVPGFRTRSSATTVRMRDGQTFAIAGLISNEMENLVKKVPGLGDIPILGVLFSSKEFARRETELIVVVTVRLVDPVDADEAPPLPGEDRVSDPTDLELFLLNITEADGQRARRNGPGPQASLPTSRQPIGKVGFWR
jgi:pilus assembly protein CpaC